MLGEISEKFRKLGFFVWNGQEFLEKDLTHHQIFLNTHLNKPKSRAVWKPCTNKIVVFT